ncbi:MAG: GIY-YIG nuclease family protein [Spirochaetia bacterium]|nr:GIY-YIG nuclease family protein [Spirochaetia bacterium]
MAFVYILKCSDKTYYTGAALNLEERIEKHQSGRAAKYTSGRRPVKLIYHEELENLSAAYKREAAIKRLSRKEKELLIKKAK